MTAFDSHDYARMPDGLTLRKNCRQYLAEQPRGYDPQPGDVALLWISVRRYPQHMAIFVPWDGRLGIIHAHQRFDYVMEHSFDSYWIKRLVGVFIYPGVD